MSDDLELYLDLAEQGKRIEELEKACAEWAEVSQSNYQRAKAAEAKLAKAVEALREISQKSMGEGGCYYTNRANIMLARTTLAELNYDERSEKKGQGDE